MKEKTGTVFSIADENPPIPGCTVSRGVFSGESIISYYSLARGTDISAEIYPSRKLILVNSGTAQAYGNDFRRDVDAGSGIFLPLDTPAGVSTQSGTVYTEIIIERNSIMNSAINPGEVFSLAELVPYSEGKIVNMDVVHNSKMKFAVMAFDAGTGLSEHAAPGEALIFALDGEGIIGYEGSEHTIKAGENFCFAKGGLHYVKAESRFKMALLLTLE